jgi:hypothetical protein
MKVDSNTHNKVNEYLQMQTNNNNRALIIEVLGENYTSKLLPCIPKRDIKIFFVDETNKFSCDAIN